MAHKSTRDAELYKAQTARIELYLNFILRCLKVLMPGTIVVYFMYSINAYLLNGADKLTAVAAIVESFHLTQIVSVLSVGVTGLAWYRERKGKQRAISEKGYYQHLAEAGESNRTSSGLTEIGTTPPGDD